MDGRLGSDHVLFDAVIKQPLSKCLVHLLQEINPEAAAQMGSRELASKKSNPETTKVRYSRAIRICRKVKPSQSVAPSEAMYAIDWH